MKTDQVNPVSRFKGLMLDDQSIIVPEQGLTTDENTFVRLAKGQPHFLHFMDGDEGKLAPVHSALIEIQGTKRQGDDLMVAFKIVGEAPEGAMTKQSVTLLFTGGQTIEGVPSALIDTAWMPSDEE